MEVTINNIQRVKNRVLKQIYPVVDNIQWKTVHMVIVLVLPF